MTRIFISYRREDTGVSADRLFEELSREFGKRQIFMDFKSLKPGSNFVEQIVKTIASCKVLIVLIGPNWLKSPNQTSDNLNKPASEDFVMIEIAAAIDSHIPVIPVLVDGAKMPCEKEMPDALKSFAKIHALEIGYQRWQHDVKLLIALLKDYAGGKYTKKALAAAGGAGAVAGAAGGNALLSLLGATGVSATPFAVGAAVPVAILGGAGLVGYLAYKGARKLFKRD